LWLPEGSLACPECHTIVYRQHLNEMGQQALAQEREGLWVEARATWQSMLAGPTAGLLAAVGCYGLYAASVGHVALSAGKAVDPGSNAALWGALAHTGAWLNLINLVPVLGLDGAQATTALNRVQRAIVLASAIAFFVMLQEGVFIFIALGMAWRLFTGAAPEKAGGGTMVRYMLLLFLLGALMWVAPDMRQ